MRCKFLMHNQGYDAMTPAQDETPFFCLLENDRLMTKVSVNRLLSNVKNDDGDRENEARVVITVHIKPRDLHLWNIQYG
jgi:hypothetical protein